MARLEVITGPMCGGKSEEVVKRLKRPGYKNKSILAIKPEKDTRTERDVFKMIDDDKFLKTYSSLQTNLIKNKPESFKSLIDIQNPHNIPDIIVVEEVHMLGQWLTNILIELLDIKDIDPEFTIIVAGLDKDHLQVPWEPIRTLMVHADEVTKLLAVCQICGQAAQLTYKMGGNPNLRKEVGGEDMYQARCRYCHKLPSVVHTEKPQDI